MNRLARMMVLTLALLCLFTAGAGAAVARLLPPRLALFEMPQVRQAGVARPGAVLRGATGSPPAGRGGVATAAGVSASLDGLVRSGDLGPQVGALVTDLSTGQVLYALNPSTGFTPASTTKLATAVAALDTLGPNARFTTLVRAGGRLPGQLAGWRASYWSAAAIRSLRLPGTRLRTTRSRPR